MPEETRAETYDEILSEIIEGRTETIRPHLARAVAGTINMGRIMAEVIAHELADPVAVLAIATVLEQSALILDVDDEEIMRVEAHGTSSTWVRIAPGIEWWGSGRLKLVLPETIAQASVGMPLASIVSHPVLDRHALTVTGIDSWVDGMTVLITDDEALALTADEILAIRPGRTETDDVEAA